MPTIALTISGDTPSSISLIALTRSDTGLPPSGVTLPIAFALANGAWQVSFTDPGSPPALYNYTYQINWSDSSSEQIAGTMAGSGNWPVTLDDVKQYLRVDASDDDSVISSLIDFACDFLQRETGQQMLTATYTTYLDRFPVKELGVSFITGTMQVASSRHEIRLDHPPLQSITSIQYLTNGSLTTLDPSLYTVDVSSKPGRIVLNCGQSWPVTDGVANAVKIVYVAGYGDASTVPNMFKQAIKWFVAHCYENREAVTVDARVAVQELPWGLRSIVESLMFREAHCA